MPLYLHIVFRQSSALALFAGADLSRINSSSEVEQGAEVHRVLELAIGGACGDPFDLAINERQLPEVLSVIYQAEEIHLYGVDVPVLLHAFPDVRAAALQQTALIVHGPCEKTPEELRGCAPVKLEVWPGPVRYDRPASESLQKNIPTSELVPYRMYLDPWDHSLSPRQGPSGPIEGLAEEAAVVVCLSAYMCPELKDTFRPEVESYFNASPEPVDVAWIDETSAEPGRIREFRRVAQLFVASSWADPGILEAILAGTPVWVLDHAQTPLKTWLEEIKINPKEHSLGEIGSESFRAHWNAGIARWTQGQSLPDNPEARERLIQFSLASAGPFSQVG